LSSTQNPGSNLKSTGHAKFDDEPMDIHMSSPFPASSVSAINKVEMQTPKQQLYSQSLKQNLTGQSATQSPVMSATEMLNQDCNSPSNNNKINNDEKKSITANSQSNNLASSSSNSLLPLDLIREMIKDSTEDLRDELMSESFRFKAEVLKEFMSLKVKCIQN
jgi:hypothetical protein